MIGLEIFGIVLVVVSIIYAFIKKQDRLGLALIIVLLTLLLLLSYFGKFP